jgi:hypothetical protein
MKLCRSRRMAQIGALAGITFVSLALGSAAAGRKPKPAKPDADYFPLRVGDTWTYRHSESGGYTWKVLSEEPQDGGTIRYLVELNSGVIIHSLYSKAGGWVLLHAETYTEHEAVKATYDPPKRYLPNPLVAGQTWEWTGKDPTQTEFHEKHRVVGLENITVPAGKFRAMKVISEITGGNISQTKTSWYAPDVGLVKSTTEASQITYGFELADYSFKKK